MTTQNIWRVALTLLIMQLTATTAGAADITQNTAVVINSGNKAMYNNKSIAGTVPDTSQAGNSGNFISKGAIVVDGIELNLTIDGFNVDFIGITSPTVIYEDSNDKHNLYLGDDNTLYYPTVSGYTVNACRAYFQLKNGLTAGEPTDPNAHAVRVFNLNFGDGESQGITTTDFTDYTDRAGVWYSLDGCKLDGKPTKAGLYIYNGRKVVIK